MQSGFHSHLNESKTFLTQDIWGMEWCNRIHEWKSWPGLVFVILPRDNPPWGESNFYCYCLISVSFCQHSNVSEGRCISHSGWQGDLRTVTAKQRKVPEKDTLKPSWRWVSVLSSCWQSEVLWLNSGESEMFWVRCLLFLY